MQLLSLLKKIYGYGCLKLKILTKKAKGEIVSGDPSFKSTGIGKTPMSQHAV